MLIFTKEVQILIKNENSSIFKEPIKVFEMDRIIIFKDNSNIFKGFRKYNIKADYEKLKHIITRGRNLRDIFLYEGAVYPMSPEKKKWYEDLSNRSGYEIKASFDKMAFYYYLCIKLLLLLLN